MPTHQRQLVRDATVLKLKGTADPRPTAAGDRVKSTRLTPWRAGNLPAISVYVADEDVDREKSDEAPRRLHRVANIVVEGVLAAVAEDQLDDALDSLAQEIETALAADPWLGGTAVDSILLRTELGTVTIGERPHGAVQLTYAVTYETAVPDTAVPDDLKTVSAKYSLGNAVHPNNQPEDRLVNMDTL
jgi:hypothetical protein